MTDRTDRATLDRLFLTARSHNGWLDRPVIDDQLERLYDIARMGPTSMNCSPARFVFVRSAEGKRRLEPAISPGNLDKAMTAPVVAIIGYDLDFHEHLPRLFPHREVRPLFEDNAELASTTAFRNGTLQGAYVLLAARALGLDCAPMSGFTHAVVDEAFFAGTRIRSNFLCGLGYGDPGKLFPRHPRFAFDDVCRLA